MNESLLIPSKLKVGFNLRQDTYSKKLAFIVYYKKNETYSKPLSFDGWIQKEGDEVCDEVRDNIGNYETVTLDSSYNPIDMDNVPTSGFVLNRGGGGARESYGHNARNEFIRVFDPRGFEIEIGIANLLFILRECDSTKGKALEGEFVYSWNGKDLILLPCSSLDYEESVKFTGLQKNYLY